MTHFKRMHGLLRPFAQKTTFTKIDIIESKSSPKAKANDKDKLFTYLPDKEEGEKTTTDYNKRKIIDEYSALDRDIPENMKFDPEEEQKEEDEKAATEEKENRRVTISKYETTSYGPQRFNFFGMRQRISNFFNRLFFGFGMFR